MRPQNAADWLHIEKSTLREKVRKTAIVVLLLGSLVPTFLLNIGMNVKAPVSKLNRSFLSFRALLLCQHWTLFGYIVPFNFTMHFEVELRDGRIVALRDLKKERAGKWQPLLFHNERKTALNLYANRPALRRYMEYLIRTNGVDFSQVTRRTIFIRYRNVFPRKQASAAAAYYGPETKHVLENY